MVCIGYRSFGQVSVQTKRPGTTVSPQDTSKINSLARTADGYYLKGQLGEAEKIAHLVESESKKIGYKKGIALSLNIFSRVLYRRGSYDSSIFIGNQALKIGRELKDSILQSSSLISIANANSYMGNYNLAIDYYFKGLAIEEKIKPQFNLQWYFSNLGNVYSNQKNYPKALEYTLKAKNLVEQNKSKQYLNIIYNNIGWIYMLLGKYDSAYYSMNKCLQLADEANDYYVKSLCLDNLSQLYIRLKKYDQAYEVSKQSYKIGVEQGLKEQTVSSLITMGTINIERNNLPGAENDLTRALDMAKEIKSHLLIRDAAFQLALLYKKQSNFKTAYSYYKIYSEVKDSLLNEENSKLLTEMNTKYTTEKKEKEIELLKKNEDIQKLEISKKKNELDRQRNVSLSILAGFLLLMIVAILLFSRYRLKKKANDQLQTAFNLIEEKNAVIEKSNVMITDSITYAKRIQDAILPAEEDLSKIFSEDFFILYKPSQIVSGDFYWCSSHHNKIVFVVADCTGHGVPGAFMSMIGNTLLNEIVNERKVTDTKKIAELLDEKIILALHQHEGSQKYDGMDISICCIDKENKKISFTGAHHSLYIFNSHLEKIKGDPYSIGGAQHQRTKVFTSKTIDFKKGLHVYLLTDGYCDQSGGDSNKRFSSRQFESLLQEIHQMPMNDQKNKLENAFENWMGGAKQRDDVLIVGIKC
jgi:serine phosphatase RsbU (regulator of sigma subunit)